MRRNKDPLPWLHAVLDSEGKKKKRNEEVLTSFRVFKTKAIKPRTCIENGRVEWRSEDGKSRVTLSIFTYYALEIKVIYKYIYILYLTQG